ncbi:flavodoxin domain-containing protein [Virgibacillus sp. W0430]|uniref:flavodoxin domain-containing protein n=1 Tax=Virgibacillus sp. W0430 TaxID=3391580 RepID=UPI003F46C0B3
MAKVFIVYTSATGNTEIMAEAMVDYFIKAGHTVVLKTFDFDLIKAEELGHYDAVLVGTYTWDDGELPYEVEDFYDALEEVELIGVVFGVFGSADSFYDTYGGAIDLIAEQANKTKATVVPERLKVDLEPDEADIRRCQAFANKVCTLIKANKKDV